MLNREVNEFVLPSVFESRSQSALYWTDAKEIFFGGRTGCGKTHALIAAMLRFVHEPSYRGIILRKQRVDAKRSSGILARMKQHLQPWLKRKEVTWNGETNTFTFPSGATIEFGYMTAGFDESYQGGEYHQIGVDELTQHSKETYLWWFSRNRRKKEDTHIPLRILSTGNPGGVGNDWVKAHFRIENTAPEGEEKTFRGTHPTRLFIQGRIEDNPGIDRDSYEKSNANLSDVLFAQLVKGDWDANNESRFKADDFLLRHRRMPVPVPTWYFYEDEVLAQNHPPVLLKDNPNPEAPRPLVFHTVDPAITEKTGVGGVRFDNTLGRRDRGPSFSAVASWVYSAPHLLLVEVFRGQIEAPALLEKIKAQQAAWGEGEVLIEANGVGGPIGQFLAQAGVPVVPLKTHSSKLVNSQHAQHLASQHRIILPEMAPWLRAYEEEFFSWTGHPDETDDQVDVTSMACAHIADEVFLDTPSNPPAIPDGRIWTPHPSFSTTGVIAVS